MDRSLKLHSFLLTKLTVTGDLATVAGLFVSRTHEQHVPEQGKESEKSAVFQAIREDGIDLSFLADHPRYYENRPRQILCS